MITLRDDQSAIIDQTRAELSRHRSVLICAPTGFGKTILTAYMLHMAAYRGNDSVFLVHRKELLDQTVDTLEQTSTYPGLIASGYRAQPERAVQVAMVTTLVSRLDVIKPPKLLVVDECHHVMARSYRTILDAWPNTKVVGLTATPERPDGQGLGSVFDVMVEGPSVSELIAAKRLSDYEAWNPHTPDTRKMRVQAGEYRDDDVQAEMSKPTITGNIMDHWHKLAHGRRSIAFAVSIKASQELAAAFCGMGVSAAHVDGDTPKKQRRHIIEQFKLGRITMLCNVDLFGEGLDVPGAKVAILARPTTSLGLHRQQIGRVMRYQDGETALILDHAGNLAKHGFPDDDVIWSLAGRVKKTRKEIEQACAVRTCQKCYACSPAYRKTCERCKEPFPLTPREVRQQEGELSLAARRKRVLDRRRQEGMADSYDALVALAKQRGYANPHGWAWYRMKVRAQKERGK